MGKRYLNTWFAIAFAGSDSDVIDDLGDAVVQEESGGLRGTVGVVADELKVSLRRPEAARPYAKRVVETQVATALLAAGQGGKSTPVPGLASLQASRCSRRCRS